MERKNKTLTTTKIKEMIDKPYTKENVELNTDKDVDGN